MCKGGKRALIFRIGMMAFLGVAPEALALAQQAHSDQTVQAVEACQTVMARARAAGQAAPPQCQTGEPTPNVLNVTMCEEPGHKICAAGASGSSGATGGTISRQSIEAQAREQVRAATDDTLREMGFRGGLIGLLGQALRTGGLPVIEPPADRTFDLNSEVFNNFFAAGFNYDLPSVEALRPTVLNNCSFSSETAATLTERGHSLLALLHQITSNLEPHTTFDILQRNLCNSFSGRSDNEIQFCRDATVRGQWRNQILALSALPANDPRRVPAREALRQRFSTLIDTMFELNENAPDDRYSTEFREYSMSAFSLCQSLQRIYMGRARDIGGAYFNRFTMSRPFVRSLERRFYSPERIAASQRLISELRADLRDMFVNEIAPRARLQTSQREQVLREWDSFGVSNFEAVPDELFVTRPDFPLPTIRISEEDRSIARFLNSGSPLVRLGLSGFLHTNGVYMPAQANGRMQHPEMFDFNPVFMLGAASRPDTLRQVIGHELAHKFGPMVSGANGVRLHAAYDQLLNCLTSRISVAENQRDETIADWFSSELFARYVGRLSTPQQRIEAMREFAEPLCIFLHSQNSSDLGMAFNGGESSDIPFDSHPDPYFRLNFLFGRHPIVQDILGCRPRASYCDLNGETRGESR